jgi:uncharacterized protein YbjT (DUF2867 family)
MTTEKELGMILVTGATGNIGKHLVRSLAAMDRRTRVVVRDPSRFDGDGVAVEIVQGDLDQPGTLEPAFRGMTALFMRAPGTDAPAQDGIARRCGRHRGDGESGPGR